MKVARRTAQCAAAILLSLSFLLAQQGLTSAQARVYSDWFQEVRLERADLMRAAFLNYETFAADVGWVALVVNYGAGHLAVVKFENLENNGEVVRALDPRFFRLYEWFPAVYLNRVYPVTFERAEYVTNFLQPGFEAFPNDGRLPFHAAMSYIGIQNPVGEGPQRRYERVIELAQLSALRGDPDAAGVLPFYRARLEGSPAESHAAEAEFLLKLFARAESAREREQISEQLKALGTNADALAASLERFKAFNRQHTLQGAYLRRELFAMVYP